MKIYTINGKEYKIRFGYKALAKSGSLKRFAEVQNLVGKAGSSEFELFEPILDVLSHICLAGLQKFHADQFGCDYDNPKEVKKAMDAVYDFLDELIDSVDGGAMEVFTDMSKELFDSGFFGKSQRTETLEAAEKVDATVIPIGHMK